MKILDIIRSRIGIQVPTPIYRSQYSVVYPFLEGQPFLRETLLKLESDAQVRTAEQHSTFRRRKRCSFLIPQPNKVCSSRRESRRLLLCYGFILAVLSFQHRNLTGEAWPWQQAKISNAQDRIDIKNPD
jgi:hypothetical protein